MSETSSQSIAKLADALCKAQGKFKPAAKINENPFFHSKYAGLKEVLDACGDSLRANGITFTQLPQIVNGQVVLETRIMHTSGEWVSGIYPLNPVKNDPQGLGSCMTYARRYSLSAAVGVCADEDDDGNSASGKNEVPSEVFDRAKNVTPPKSTPPPRSATAKPEQKPEPEMDNGGACTKEIVVGKVKVDQRTGTNGKPYTKFSTKANDNEWYSTFDMKIGNKLQNLAGDNAVITYELVKGKYRTITQILPLADPAEEVPPVDDPDKEHATKEEDNLPF